MEQHENIKIIKQAYDIINKNRGIYENASLLNVSCFDGISDNDYIRLDNKLKAIRQDYAKILTIMNCIERTYSLYKSNQYIPSYVTLHDQATAELGCFIEYLFSKYRVILEYIYQILEITIFPRLGSDERKEYDILKKDYKKYKFLLNYVIKHHSHQNELLNIEWFQQIRIDRDFIVHDGATCLVFGDKDNLLFKVMNVDALDKDDEILDEFYLDDKGLIYYKRYWGLYISKLILFFVSVADFLKDISHVSENGKFLLELGILEKTEFVEADGTPCPKLEDVVYRMLESLLQESTYNEGN